MRVCLYNCVVSVVCLTQLVGKMTGQTNRQTSEHIKHAAHGLFLKTKPNRTELNSTE